MPHVCGDEPLSKKHKDDTERVCPTYVGMNRATRGTVCTACRMPHVCGDEPAAKKWLEAENLYAPRMWG